jgi:putative ABC transport system permease protein
MNVGQITRSALRSITRNKLRSSLMMIGVIVGVGAMTVVTALGESTVKGVMDKIASTFSANNIFLAAGGGRMHGGARGDGPTTTLTMDDMEAIAAQVPNIDKFAPSARVGKKMVTYKGKNRQVRITGHSEAAELLYRKTSRGAFFGRDDVQGSARVALIGQDAAAEFFGSADPIGEQVRIATVPFEIVGVLEKGGVDVHGINTDDAFFVPVTTAMRRLLNVDHISAAKLHVRDATRMEATVASIKRVLRERHKLSAEKPDDFAMITPVQVQQMVESSNRTMTVFLPLISAIAILVGAFIIASLMLVAVNERRPEIGLRKAVGARSKDIQTQFLIESITITVVAGIVGLLVGGIVSQLVLNMQSKPLTLPLGAMGIGLATSVVVGVLAGVIPARRAAALDPVETLR